MLRNPKIGQRVELRYRPALRKIYSSADGREYHGCFGIVMNVGKSRRCRNHLVQLADGREVIVPAGNLRKVEP